MYTCIYMRIYVYLPPMLLNPVTTCKYMHIHICKYIFMYLHIHIYKHIYISIYLSINSMYMHMKTRTHKLKNMP